MFGGAVEVVESVCTRDRVPKHASCLENVIRIYSELYNKLTHGHTSIRGNCTLK